MNRIPILLILFLLPILQLTGQSAEDFQEQARKAAGENDLQTAIEFMNRAIESDSTDAGLYLEKGRYQQMAGIYLGAYRSMTKALSLDPDNHIAYNSRGILLESLRDYKNAIGDYSRAIEYAPSDSVRSAYINNRGVARLGTRDFESAYDDLTAALEIDPANEAALINLGAVCDEMDRPEEALIYLKRAVALDSSDYAAYGNIGFVLQNSGRHEEAIKYFNIVLEYNPNDPFSYNNRGFSKLKLGDLEGALADIEKSLSIYPENSYAFKNRALVFLEKGNTEQACMDLDRALKLGYTARYGEEVQRLKEQSCK